MVFSKCSGKFKAKGSKRRGVEIEKVWFHKSRN